MVTDPPYGVNYDPAQACGFDTRAQIVWAKNNFAIPGRGTNSCGATSAHRNRKTEGQPAGLLHAPFCDRRSWGPEPVADFERRQNLGAAC
jgi:hypothetical protein